MALASHKYGWSNIKNIDHPGRSIGLLVEQGCNLEKKNQWQTCWIDGYLTGYNIFWGMAGHWQFSF
jgi:hypothetical protein